MPSFAIVPCWDGLKSSSSVLFRPLGLRGMNFGRKIGFGENLCRALIWGKVGGGKDGPGKLMCVKEFCSSSDQTSDVLICPRHPRLRLRDEASLLENHSASHGTHFDANHSSHRFSKHPIHGTSRHFT